MHLIMQELLPIRLAHVHFANWERARHRADFFAKVSFPDSHPIRAVVDATARDLEDYRCAADVTIANVARKNGDFRCVVNGYFFEDATEWFQSGTSIYRDCPEISFGKGVRRRNKLNLAGLASFHELEVSGKCFIDAVNMLLDVARPTDKGKLVRNKKLFDKDCVRLETQLKRVKVCERDVVGALLCLRRKGLPNGIGKAVLAFLV